MAAVRCRREEAKRNKLRNHIFTHELISIIYSPSAASGTLLNSTKLFLTNAYQNDAGRNDWNTIAKCMHKSSSTSVFIGNSLSSIDMAIYHLHFIDNAMISSFLCYSCLIDGQTNEFKTSTWENYCRKYLVTKKWEYWCLDWTQLVKQVSFLRKKPNHKT